MRLVTYNIHKGIGGRDRRYSLDRVIEVIESLDVDFICLQEVDRNLRRSRFDHQPERLIDALQPSTSLDQLVFPRANGGYGNLILSRWPFLESEQFSIRKGRRKPRGGQIAVVDSPEGPFVLGHAHLGLNERERHWQMDRLISHERLIARKHLPAIVTGDTNDWRNTLHRGALERQGFTQVTSPSARFRTFPAYLPMASLDKVFVRGEISVNHAEVVRTRLSRRASDHLPVILDFNIFTS